MTGAWWVFGPHRLTTDERTWWRRLGLALLVAIVPFVTVGVLGWALVPVVIAIVPLSIAAAALERRA